MAGEGVVERLVLALGFTVDDAGANKAESVLDGIIMAAGAAAAALTALSISTAQEIEQIDRLASGLGMTVNEALGTSYAFQTYGANINDVSDALQTLSDYSLEAVNGTESFVDAFKQVGVSVSDLRGKAPDELLRTVAEGFASTEDATLRAATASQLFGDDVGRKLLPLLMQGADGFDALRAEAADLSGVIDDDAVAASRALSTDLRRMGLIVSGVGRRIGLEFMPAVKAVTGATLEWWGANKQVVTSRIDTYIGGLSDALVSIDTPLEKAVAGIVGLGVAGKVAVEIGKLATTIPLLGPAISRLGPAAAALTAALPTVALVAGLALAIDDLVTAAQGGDSVFADMAASMGAESEFRQALVDIGDLADAAGEGLLQLGISAIDGVADLLAQVDYLQSFADVLRDIGTYLSEIDLAGWLADFSRGAQFVTSRVRTATAFLAGDRPDLAINPTRLGVQPGVIEDLAGAAGLPTLGGSADGSGSMLIDPTTPGFSMLAPGSVYQRPNVTDNRQVSITVNGGDTDEVRRVVAQTLEASYLDAQGVSP